MFFTWVYDTVGSSRGAPILSRRLGVLPHPPRPPARPPAHLTPPPSPLPCSFGVVLWELLTGERPWHWLSSTFEVVSLVGFQFHSIAEHIPSRLADGSRPDTLLVTLCEAICSTHVTAASRPTFASIVVQLEANLFSAPG